LTIGLCKAKQYLPRQGNQMGPSKKR